MRAIGFNHLSVGAKDLEASLTFYETVFGMERIPTYNFGFTTQYLRCGKLQLHVFRLDDHVPVYQHFALDVDDFHAVYEAAKRLGALDGKTFRNAVNELPDGSVQMYLRDPGGNLLEVDWPDVNTLDRSRIPELKKLADFAEQTGDALQASLYLDRPGFNPTLRA
jgi:catechol 2,3-dioxygenase-like lactoylglutathione lyase family enzyme